MGAAIWVMHYTGMASGSFISSASPPNLSHAVSISSLGAAGIGAVALLVLAVALMTSTWDRLQKQNSLLRATSGKLRALSARLQSAREEEAMRIAREIHDELGAALTSVRWHLETIDEAISEAAEQ